MTFVDFVGHLMFFVVLLFSCQTFVDVLLPMLKETDSYGYSPHLAVFVMVSLFGAIWFFVGRAVYLAMKIVFVAVYARFLPTVYCVSFFVSMITGNSIVFIVVLFLLLVVAKVFITPIRRLKSSVDNAVYSALGDIPGEIADTIISKG